MVSCGYRLRLQTCNSPLSICLSHSLNLSPKIFESIHWNLKELPLLVFISFKTERQVLLWGKFNASNRINKVVVGFRNRVCKNGLVSTKINLEAKIGFALKLNISKFFAKSLNGFLTFFLLFPIREEVFVCLASQNNSFSLSIKLFFYPIASFLTVKLYFKRIIYSFMLFFSGSKL